MVQLIAFSFQCRALLIENRTLAVNGIDCFNHVPPKSLEGADPEVLPLGSVLQKRRQVSHASLHYHKQQLLLLTILTGK